jgi:outer membrane receptor protein involved in Fe transport
LLLFLLLFAGAALATEESEPAAPNDDKSESPEEIEAGQNIADLLQGQDGVRIQTMCTHCNSANIQVGGLSQDLAPLYRNGYPVIGGLATSIALNVLPPDAIAGVEVEKGPGSASVSGAAAGGTIRLTESTPLEVPLCEVVLEGGSYDSINVEARVAGPIRPWLSGMITAGQEAVDEVDDDGDGWNDVAAIERTFAEGQLQFDIGQDHDVDLGLSWIEEDDTFGRGRWDNLAWDWQNPDAFLGWVREDTSFDRLEYRGGWSWRMGRDHELKLQLLGSERDQFVIAQETRESEFFPELMELRERFIIREENYWGGLTYQHWIGHKGVLRAGIESRRDRLDADSLVPLTVPAEYQPGTDRVKLSSAFAEFEWTPSPKWNLQFGLRFDDASWEAIREDLRTGEEIIEKRSKERLLPRFAVRFKPANPWTLRLIAGGTFRVPKPIMSEVCCGQEYQKSVNTFAEIGETIGLETIYQPSPDLRANLYIAQTRFEDHIMRIVGWSAGYTQTYTLANMAEARADTAEIALRWSPHRRVTLDGSIGWLSFKNRNDELVTVGIDRMGSTTPVSLAFERVPYLPIRTASLSASVSLPCESVVTLGAAYTGEMLIQYFDVNNQGPNMPFGNKLQEDLRRTDDFWLVNLSVEVPISHGFGLFLAVNNLGDYIQTDLGDPMTDYNWGPLSGRSYRLGLRYHFDR